MSRVLSRRILCLVIDFAMMNTATLWTPRSQCPEWKDGGQVAVLLFYYCVLLGLWLVIIAFYFTCAVLQQLISFFLFFFFTPSSRRSGEHRQRYQWHALLTLLTLQQPAFSVPRAGRWNKHWGRGAETGRESVSLRPFHHDSTHFPHTWHVTWVCTPVHNTDTDVGSELACNFTASVFVLQWSWNDASTLSSEKVWWRVVTGQLLPHTQATGAHTT